MTFGVHAAEVEQGKRISLICVFLTATEPGRDVRTSTAYLLTSRHGGDNLYFTIMNIWHPNHSKEVGDETDHRSGRAVDCGGGRTGRLRVVEEAELRKCREL